MSIFTHTKSAGAPTWFDLMTPDAPKTRDFYQALFGWQYIVSGPEMGYYSMAQLNGHMAAGISPTMPGNNNPSVWSVYLATNDIKADSARIVQLGGQLIVEPMQVADQGWMVIAIDPTGAAFRLWQGGQHIGATITEEPGSMAWCEVNTRDAVKARDFYCALYGLTWEPVQGMEYYTLKDGEQYLAGVLQMDHNWPDSIPAHWIPYFSVASADETAKLAAQNGGQVRIEPFDSPHGRIAWIADPFGATFVVVAMTAA